MTSMLQILNIKQLPIFTINCFIRNSIFIMAHDTHNASAKSDGFAAACLSRVRRHGALLHRCKSYGQVFAEPKQGEGKGVVARRSLKEVQSKAAGDEQKPDRRRDASGTSGHVTAKSSICDWGAFCKSGVYAAKVTCLTREISPMLQKNEAER